MASSNQTPDVLFSPIAANADASDINTIPQTYDPSNYGYAAQNVGFPTECRLPVLNPDGTLGQGRAPRMQDWNGIMKLVSSHNFFLQNGGSYTFNPTVSSNIGGYPKNAILWYFPENEAPCIVYSLINDNTNNFVDDPTLIDGTHWEMLVNPSSYANIDLSNLSTTGEAHFANPDLSNLSATGEARFITIPTGAILPYGGSTAPTGWLLCSGGAISRTTYADLFAVIGTNYGAGDGSTTYNLPNYINRVPQGMGMGYLNAGLPNITGTFATNAAAIARATGFFAPNVANVGVAGNGFAHNVSAIGTLTASAAYSNSIYGASTTVQPPATKSNFIIKY